MKWVRASKIVQIYEVNHTHVDGILCIVDILA